MKRIIYFTLLFAAVFVCGCKKSKVEFDQPTQVEFKPITATLAKGTVAVPATITILVQLVGAQQSTDISVPYTIDATSTAVEGLHYTSTGGTGGNIIIPANSSVGRLVLTSIPTSTGTGRRLILLLTDGATVPVSQNYKKSTITVN